MPLHYAVDRFEDNGWAVLERSDGETFNVPREWVPEDASEGDVLKVDTATEGKASRLSFTVDAAERERRRKAIGERYDRLPKGPKGNFDL